MRQTFHHNCQGSVLVSAVISTVILSIVIALIASYMGNEYQLQMRSDRWSQALHLAEAATEIGIAEMNYQYFLDTNGFSSARGWTSLGGGSYTKSVSQFVDNAGHTVGDMTVSVLGIADANPQIRGVGEVTMNAATPKMTRAVRLVLALSSKFPMGFVARQTIDLNGNGIYTDSFDSTDTGKSTGGLYDAAKRQANGDIASNSSVINTVNIGNAEIYGTINTGYGGSAAMGPNGTVGPTFVNSDRATTTAEAEAAGWVQHDFSVDVPSVNLPAVLASAPSLGSLNGTATISSGDWQASQIRLTGNDQLTISGNVRLYVTGDVDVSGSTSSIIIEPGAHLEVYVAGSVAIAGNGVVNNTGVAVNNQFYGLPTSTSWSVSGNGQWVGTIYAPQAALTLDGGGTSGDMSGGVVALNITLNGHTHFHYDEALRKDQSVAAGYVVSAWQQQRFVSGNWVAE